MARARTRLLTSAGAALALLVPLAAPASAATVSPPIASGFAGPLQFSVHGSTLYVAQDFAGTLTKITPTSRTDVAHNNGELAGVDREVFGTVLYTTNTSDGPPGPDATVTSSSLRRLLPSGRSYQVADLFAYEKKNNPDQVNTYGFQGLDAACAAQVPAEVGGGSPYAGQFDTHAYSVASLPLGYAAVADAAANDVLLVSPLGRIRTLAVLPPSPTTVTSAIAAASGLPDCTVGATYNFQPVPTDVEVGHDGNVYVSSLPGGPEDASLGARGAVYRVNIRSGATERVAGGFVGATNVAVDQQGNIYVAELFADRISKISGGVVSQVASLPSPAAVEWANGKLYASENVFSPGGGDIVSITP